ARPPHAAAVVARARARPRPRPAPPPPAPPRPPPPTAGGHGPPRHLTADRVPLRAEALSGLTYDQLLDAVEPSELTEAEVHPLIWEDRAPLERARDGFAGLTETGRSPPAVVDVSRRRQRPHLNI
ncbi:DUF1877 family protein, partial [Streptomyces sp. NPDC059082]|uniref:DUF1877 family protein n=1 Tax=Streptomyces sp. NPDC059082 TaxID=3346720 RepID=UPI0036B76CC6